MAEEQWMGSQITESNRFSQKSTATSSINVWSQIMIYLKKKKKALGFLYKTQLLSFHLLLSKKLNHAGNSGSYS